VLSLRAPAKINLGLHVLRKREDGFHALDSLFFPIAWADTLSVSPSAHLEMTCSDPSLPVDGSNLVLKAAEAVRKKTGVREGALFHLEKRIPHGGGLGGGSSDAASALRLAMGLWQVDLPHRDLHEMAAGLGSDVPFFVEAAPARATGRGELLEPLTDAQGAPFQLPFEIVVAVPRVMVPTAHAYRLITPDAHQRPDLVSAVRSLDLERYRRELTNDFEAPVCAAYPALARTRTLLEETGAEFVSMSGSGSAFFALYESPSRAQAAADLLAAHDHRVWTGGMA